MYKLELLIVNPKENLFPIDVCLSTEQEKQDCNNKMVEASSKFWDPKIGKLKRTFTPLLNGAYRQEIVWSFFDSITDAEEFFKIRLYFDHPYRKLESQFVKEHNLLTELNILNLDDTIAKNVHSCNTDNCMKFGNCKTITQGGCFDDITKVGQNLPKYFHIKQIDYSGRPN